MPIYNNKDYLRVMRPLPNYVERDAYGVPVIQPQRMDLSAMNNGLWLINMKNMSSKDKLASSKIVHSFCYDNVLDRAYNNPLQYLARAAPYLAVSSFDFSMHPGMDFPQILYATYKNRWSGVFAQTHGKIAFPTVGWVGPDLYDITFSGLRDGGIFLISTLGTNNPLSRGSFLEGYHEMRRRFPNTTIICVGDRIEGMDHDVCFIKYEDSFGSRDLRQDWWQPRFINWDMTIAKEYN